MHIVLKENWILINLKFFQISIDINSLLLFYRGMYNKNTEIKKIYDYCENVWKCIKEFKII